MITFRNRIEAAQWLTDQFETRPTGTFLRLGDGELAFLLACQDDPAGAPALAARRPASLAGAQSLPGLQPEDANELRTAYEAADLVDLYTQVPYSRENYNRLRWHPQAAQRQFQVVEGSGLLFTWALRELPGYLARHRCLFCGSEAPLLRELLREPGYVALAAKWWEAAQPAHFLDLPQGGRDLRNHRHVLVGPLLDTIAASGVDTVFLSMGGVAKLVASEIAERGRVRVFDFGSALRALCYSASEGHATWRSGHNPFLFRIPLSIQLSALVRAFPDRETAWYARKAAMQLCLELERKIPGESMTSEAFESDILDRSPENLRAFHESRRTYNSWVRTRSHDPHVRQVDRELRQWLRGHGVGWSGVLHGQIRAFRRFVGAVVRNGSVRKST